MSDATRPGHLEVIRITQRYDDVTALDDVTLVCEGGEILTLLGPSGCGKTTLLRSIAGFIRPTAGTVELEGREITRLPPHKRPINMVFQRPALFPHLNVEGNVEFGLRLAGVPKAERVRKVGEVLDLVRLTGYERRRAHELSGGQMQRVALARALVNRPTVLLLDEPLSALDLKIRLEMESELRRVHRETGATFVYVTHDQREALALSDVIVVMNQGRIEQQGVPQAVYGSPASPFVAGFVGDANVLPVAVADDGAEAVVRVGETTLRVPNPRAVRPGDAWLVLRPETIEIGDTVPPGYGTLMGVVRDVAYRGAGWSYGIEVPGVTNLLKAETPSANTMPRSVGDQVTACWNPKLAGLLPKDPG